MTNPAFQSPFRLFSPPAILATALSLAFLPACATQEKVVRYRPFLSGIDGAQFGSQGPVNSHPGNADPTAYAGESFITNDDGSETLILASPKLVMIHLERLLDLNRDDEIISRLVSEKTRDEFARRAAGDQGILDFLHHNRKEIAKTFSRMPQAQHSPFVVLQQPGDKVWIIQITDMPARDLKFTRLWVRQEQSEWKFLWLN